METQKHRGEMDVTCEVPTPQVTSGFEELSQRGLGRSASRNYVWRIFKF